jgi:hypothetical protein
MSCAAVSTWISVHATDLSSAAEVMDYQYILKSVAVVLMPELVANSSMIITTADAWQTMTVLPLTVSL